MSYLLRLILNIMISIIACTALQGSGMQQTMSGAPATCCAAVAAAAQQRWAAVQRHSVQFAACRAGLQPSEPSKNCQRRPASDVMGPAGLGGMGGAGVAIETGCCRSTGRGALSVN